MKDVLGTHTTQMEQLVEQDRENQILIQDIQQAFNQLRLEATKGISIQKENISAPSIKDEMKELHKKITCELLKDNTSTNTKLFELEQAISKLREECKELQMKMERQLSSINVNTRQQYNERDLEEALFKLKTDLALETKRIQRLEDRMVVQRDELLNKISELKITSHNDPLRSYKHQFEYKYEQ